MTDDVLGAPWRMRLDAPTRECVRWRPTTLRQIKKDEQFLEELIAANPAMLGLEDRRAQVRGPYQAFRQRTIVTPQDREVRPDVVFLAASGHVIVVEIKLCDNGELSDRRVVAQLLDYASSLAEYEEDDLAELFGGRDGESFAVLVARLFPQEESRGELAKVLLERIQDAQLHLVIACDGAPEGLRESVRGVTRQRALGAFQIHILELVPHVADAGSQELLLLPVSPARTEIIARTAVSISYAEGQAKPGVSVQVTSAEEVEEAVRGEREIAPLLGSVVRAYDALAEPELKTRGRARNYRQIRIAGWPAAIHYEFQSYGHGEVGVELHLENDEVRPLQVTLKPLVETLKTSFPRAAWEPSWSDGRGRIMMRLRADNAEGVAASMKDFIARTRPVVEGAIARVGETA